MHILWLTKLDRFKQLFLSVLNYQFNGEIYWTFWIDNSSRYSNKIYQWIHNLFSIKMCCELYSSWVQSNYFYFKSFSWNFLSIYVWHWSSHVHFWFRILFRMMFSQSVFQFSFKANKFYCCQILFMSVKMCIFIIHPRFLLCRQILFFSFLSSCFSVLTIFICFFSLV